MTLKAGDVVFDNQYMKLEFRQVFVYQDSIDVQCLARRKSDKTYLVFSGEDGVTVNEKFYEDFANLGFTQTLTGSAEVPTLLMFKVMEKHKIDLKDIKTVDIEFLIKESYNGPVLFRDTARFEVVLPK